MIQFNVPYSIENGNDIITFFEGKKGTITGTYSNATLTGVLEGNILKATFHNSKVNAIGLIEIAFHESGFNAKWKQGLKPGPMRGKWLGILKQNTQVIENENSTSLQSSDEQYDIEKMVKDGVYSFTNKLNEFIKKGALLEDEAQDAFLGNFYSQLNRYIEIKNEFVYLGKIAEKITQNADDIWSSFYLEKDNEYREKFIFSIESLRNSGLIMLTLKNENLDVNSINNDDTKFNDFIHLLSSYFIYSLEIVAEQNDAEELAEFIFSISSSNYSETIEDENIIVDQVIDVLKMYGFSIHEYAGDCSIYPNYYLKSPIESGYNYIAMSEAIIDELYCP